MVQPQSTKPPIFDVIDIEREIEEEFRKQPSGRESPPTDFASRRSHGDRQAVGGSGCPRI